MTKRKTAECSEKCTFKWKTGLKVHNYASTTDQSMVQYSPNALNPRSAYRKRVTGELRESNSLH